MKWPPIIERARTIAESYDTPVTLRQLFYRLVAEQLIPNDRSSYQMLSKLTARLREAGKFPHFIDQNRKIDQFVTFDGPTDAIERLARFHYRRDRTAGQEVSLYLAVEKRGIVEQLRSWFGELGIPIVALGGYSSVSLLRDMADAVKASRRRAILIYAGDFDPSGEGILVDFGRRGSRDFTIEQIALNEEQVTHYRLPLGEGKPKDPRAARFIEKHGRLMQVELDALDPHVLRQLYADAIARYWDDDIYTSIIEQEEAERAELVKIAESLGTDRA
ncbi:MAG TPA: hypothetical protein VMV27_07865 [Candidatus Binataceae bacterium]|nr:hypothetical protein [Candidatus Binataceae bacterium]